MKHVYVHVPFCRRRCSYCDFAISVRRVVPARRYLDAVHREHQLQVAAGEWDDEPLETLYLGGGTPSLLPPDAVAELVAHFLPGTRGGGMGDGEREVEVTLETNPDDVTPEAAARWRAAGVNRVSLGVQSFAPEVLSWMHRTHDAEQPGHAVRVLRREGFDNLSLDLIFARPDRVGGDFRRDLEQALELEPDHLSVYGLSVEPRTPLARWISRGSLAPTGDEPYADQFLQAHETLTGAGFEHYEVSNYGLPGRRARHNSAYWTGAPYAGLGPSAHGFGRGIRRWNLAPWAAYERALQQGRSPEEGRETLTPGQLQLEAVYLGLRTSDGIRQVLIPPPGLPLLDDAVAQGMLVQEGGAIRATPEGWLRLDAMVARLTT